MSAWLSFAAPPGGAVLGLALLLRACPAEGPVADEGPDDPPMEAVAPEPSPTPIPGIDEADLLPYPADHPRFASAEALRAALAAVDADDLPAALLHLDAVDAEYAPGLGAWTRGRALRGLGRLDEAGRAWQAVPPASRWWPEAALEQATLRLDADDHGGVLSILGPTGAPSAGGLTPTRPDQAVRAEILRSRALRARGGEGDSDAAYAAFKRVWIAAPTDSEAWTAAAEGMKSLEARVPEALRPGLAEKVARTVVLARSHDNDAIVALLDGEVDALKSAEPAVGCEGHFQLGRAWQKKRTYARSVPLLGWVVDRCEDPDLAARAAYLHSEGLARSGKRTEAIAAWTALADDHPAHRFADDGLYHAGKLHLDAGRVDEARTIFLSMPDRFPEGDMVDDALWGMAWAEISTGAWADALPWLEQLASGDARSRARERVLRGRYWLSQARAELKEQDAALAGWQALAQEAPLHWYGLLALWRVEQEDPAVAREAAAHIQAARERLRGGQVERERWPVDPGFLERPALQHGIELLRGGLGAEAAEEFKLALGPDVQDTWDGDTLLFASHLLLTADDPYAGHNLLRMAFRRTWPEQDAEQRVVFAHAYPEAYGPLIEEVTADFTWDPRLFQGLVREESAFSAGIKSWAGAMGLSQLMWPTAKATAKKMGIRGLTRSDLSDPRTNLRIGSTYFEGLVTRWKGHMPLAIASYNAGPGAVSKWVRARGHLELDAWVETIPYDQTRHYVKRVATSWQIYHSLYGEEAPAVTLRLGPVGDAIGAADPDPGW